jgi:uncharacterized protein (TIGR02453 family)
MITSTSTTGFGPAATEFFEDLEDQNTREFWLAHKDVFEREVRKPMAALLDSLPEEYQPFKVFRMNRDVRFAADKSPYKTMHGAAHGTPGAVNYLHLDASGLMVACGNYMMPSGELDRYRRAVAADSSGEELSEILAALNRRRSVRIGPGGFAPLKTAPRGFPRDHPRADLLRQKGIIATRTRPPSKLQNGTRVRSFVVETFEMCADLTDWLNRYVGASPTQ